MMPLTFNRSVDKSVSIASSLAGIGPLKLFLSSILKKNIGEMSQIGGSMELMQLELLTDGKLSNAFRPRIAEYTHPAALMGSCQPSCAPSVLGVSIGKSRLSVITCV